MYFSKETMNNALTGFDIFESIVRQVLFIVNR